MFLCVATASQAATRNWTNPGTGFWYTGANWDLGTVPSAADDVRINNGGTAVADGNGNSLSKSLTMGQNIGDSGFVSVEPGGIFTGLLRPGTMNVGVLGSGSISVSGGTELQATTTVLGDGITGTGSITLSDSGSMFHTPDTATTYFPVIIGNSGIGNFTLSNSTIAVTGATTLGNLTGSSGTATVNGGSWTVDGPLTVGNAGTGEVTLNGGSLNVSSIAAGSQKITVGSLGTLRLGAGGQPGLLLASEIENNGVLQFNSSTPTTTYSMPIYGTGELQQDGTGMTNLLNASGFSGKIQVNGGALRVTGASLDLGGEEIRVSGGAMEYENSEIGEALLRGPGLHYVVNNGSSSFTDIETLPSFVMIQDGPSSFELFVNRGYLQSNHVTNVDGFWNASSGSIEVNSDMNIQDFSSDGQIRINNGATLNNTVSNLTAGGGSRTTVDAGGVLNVLGATTLELNGALLVNNGTVTGTVNVNYGSLAKGTGTYDVVNVNEGGVYSPGTSPGISTATSVNFESGSFASGAPQLTMEIGGTTLGTEYDQLDVSGLLSLGGALNVVLINGFSPLAGQSFDILNWGTLAGTFQQVNLPTLAGGLAWNTSQLYTTGVLSVGTSLPGDFDFDNDVDGFDLLKWQRGGSPTPLSLDDLDDWEMYFGTPAPLGGLSTQVPEQTSMTLSLIAAVLVGCRRRRA
ncbi:MAG: hypothetical protein KDA57_18015 [Planctomycetales bacterium]|nr:hypothetical protein [Planctomycetales bacterium]